MSEEDNSYEFRRDVAVRDVDSAFDKVQKLEDSIPHRRHRLALVHIEMAKRVLNGDDVRDILDEVDD